MVTTRTKRVGGAIGATAAAILAAVLAVEGGYVNNPADPGGATNHGVTEVVARAHGYTGRMQDLSLQQAERILYEDYLARPGFAPVMQESPAVAQELVDSAVNTGPAQASKWLQRALNALSDGGQDYPQLAVDGHVGAATTNAYKALEHRRGPVEACTLTIKLLDAQQAVFYMDLKHGAPFLVGWIDKRIGNVNLSRCADRPAES